jgi:hypothetical protein
MASKKSHRPKKSYSDSYRVKLGGSGNVFNEAEMRAMAMEAIDHAVEVLGIKHFLPTYLYVKPAEANGDPITRALGEPLKDLVIAGPYRSAADDHGL